MQTATCSCLQLHRRASPELDTAEARCFRARDAVTVRNPSSMTCTMETKPCSQPSRCFICIFSSRALYKASTPAPLTILVWNGQQDCAQIMYHTYITEANVRSLSSKSPHEFHKAGNDGHSQNYRQNAFHAGNSLWTSNTCSGQHESWIATGHATFHTETSSVKTITPSAAMDDLELLSPPQQ